MEKVIPPGINYSNIKPEAIENQIKIVSFKPVQTGKFQPGSQINFNIQSNGFFDPYSAYLKFDITLQDGVSPVNPANTPYIATSGTPIRGLFLDRSGHSCFNRLQIKSQGNELERIDQYDVMAGMINDVLYSREQKQLHHFEGFGHRAVVPSLASIAVPANDTTAPRFDNLANLKDDFITIRNHINDQMTAISRHNAQYQESSIQRDCEDSFASDPLDQFIGSAYCRKVAGQYHQDDKGQLLATEKPAGPHTYSKLQICIPLYSGVMGILMPDKRLLPLSLIPLELELTVSPHAMYYVGLDANAHRSFQLENVELFAHVLFFEQELHRSLEAVVAEHGIFVHFNTFKMCPATTIPGKVVPQFAQINSHAKSINSIHWVFLYEDYRTNARRKKLYFSSHGAQNIHVRNGTELIPSLPLKGNMYNGVNYEHSQFLVETFKAWGKMHDPTTDAAINDFNYCLEGRPEETKQGDSIKDVFDKVRVTGRAQYGISFEGEQLGQERTTITGRKGLIPMDINLGSANKWEAVESSLIPFVRMDAILYVRPDLVVQVLGV